MQHTISAVVEHRPGVLARVASMFARRGFNIHSLAVGPTEEPGLARITVVVDGPEMEQVIKQLRKLVNTIKVVEYAAGDAVEREIMLVRVSADPAVRGEVLDAATIFKAKAVDVGPTAICFQVTGEPRKLADFLDVMAPYGIVELAKSGRIALGRSTRTRRLRSAG